MSETRFPDAEINNDLLALRKAGMAFREALDKVMGYGLWFETPYALYRTPERFESDLHASARSLNSELHLAYRNGLTPSLELRDVPEIGGTVVILELSKNEQK